jgi:hypothetical protein
MSVESINVFGVIFLLIVIIICLKIKSGKWNQ